jgi:hypothetical protein
MLERVLLDKARELGLALAASAKPKRWVFRKWIMKRVVKYWAIFLYPRRSRGPNLQQKLKALYEAMKDHRDLKGRQLASIFMKLPSKTVRRQANTYFFFRESKFFLFRFI